eukprot:scaffold122038_cov51-Attheya_sp.AAC.1
MSPCIATQSVHQGFANIAPAGGIRHSVMGSVVAGSKRPIDHENDLDAAFPNKRMFRDRSFSDASSSSNHQESGKESSTIPIFLKKTYKIIETCDASIAGWTEDGEMFTVTNPDKFAATIIPQFFDHNKFSSFARQLNFYGFRKVQSKPKRAENEAPVTKGVTFYNPNFKRARVDLLRKITRSTRGGTSSSPNPLDHQKEVAGLKSHIAKLEQKIDDMSTQLEERAGRIQLELLSQIEKILSVKKSTVPAPQPMRCSLSSSKVIQPITSEWDSSTEAQAAALALSAPHPATPSPPPSSHQASKVMSQDMAPLSLNQCPKTEDTQGHFAKNTWEECFFKEFLMDGISYGPANGHAAEGQ